VNLGKNCSEAELQPLLVKVKGEVKKEAKDFVLISKGNFQMIQQVGADFQLDTHVHVPC